LQWCVSVSWIWYLAWYVHGTYGPDGKRNPCIASLFNVAMQFQTLLSVCRTIFGLHIWKVLILSWIPFAYFSSIPTMLGMLFQISYKNHMELTSPFHCDCHNFDDDWYEKQARCYWRICLEHMAFWLATLCVERTTFHQPFCVTGGGASLSRSWVLEGPFFSEHEGMEANKLICKPWYTVVLFALANIALLGLSLPITCLWLWKKCSSIFYLSTSFINKMAMVWCKDGESMNLI
jgi:hypothetical protein